MNSDRKMIIFRKIRRGGQSVHSYGGGTVPGQRTDRSRLEILGVFLLVFLAAATGGTAFAQADSPARVIDRIVAVVNGEVIALSDLNEAKARIRLHLDIPDPVSPDSTDVDPDPADRDLLNRLIERKLQIQVARKGGIQVEPSEVDQLLSEIRSNNRFYSEADLQEALQREHLSVERYRQDIENEIMILKLANREVKSGIFIDQEELKAYYEKHPDRFLMPDRVHLRQILLRVSDPEREQEVLEKARLLADRVRSGEDFQSLAKSYSEGPDAKDGGDLGFLEKAALLPIVAQALKGLESGGLTDPVRTPVGVQIFRVEEVVEGQHRLLESVEDEIRETLYQDQAIRRYREWLQNIRNSSQVEIKF